MILTHVIFYLFSVVALLLALNVIFSSNPVRAVLSLVGTFFCMAAVWIIFQAQFLGLVLVLVYVGAVMTLFLFVVMLVNVQREGARSHFARFSFLFFLGVVVVFLLMLKAVLPRYLGADHFPAPTLETYNNVAQLGSVLYTDYLYPFELAGAILLVGMIAAMSLAHRGARSRKTQDPSEQLQATKASRLRIVRMDSETPHD